MRIILKCPQSYNKYQYTVSTVNVTYTLYIIQKQHIRSKQKVTICIVESKQRLREIC